ncbi:MAG: zinc metallopeptidase, partial [Proteobacteria bacterium]|nr:zinc metallopeptidase [Pseudomonadota bacterium]
MVFIILIAIGALILFGPNLWVSHVLKKYNRNPESNFPGTGGELARHLLDRFDLHDVNVVVTEAGDHYNPHDRSVALTQDKYDGKTLAAIVIAAHECGHAIQHARGETFFHLRQWLAQSASTAQIVGSAMLAVSPIF